MLSSAEASLVRTCKPPKGVDMFTFLPSPCLPASTWQPAMDMIATDASPATTKKIYAHYEVGHLRQAFDRYSLSAEEMAKRLRKP